MKRLFIVLIIQICLVSCNQDKIQDLNNQISELKELNKKLSDSLNTELNQKLRYTWITGFPSMYKSKLNEPIQINYAFCLGVDQPLQEYDVYRIIDEDTNQKELILSKQNKAGFSYEFTPKTRKDDTVKLLLEFNIDAKTVTIPSKLYIPVE